MPRKSELQAEVESLAEEMGFPLKLSSDDDLKKFRRGELLTHGELRALPVGGALWVRYQQYDERTLRANGAFRIEWVRDGCWMFEDGSSFAIDYEASPETPDELHCEDEGGGEGLLQLFHAVPVRQRKKVTS